MNEKTASSPQDDHGEPTWQTLPPVMGALAGATAADHHMHAEARAALLTLLIEDPEVDALFGRWRDETDAGRVAVELSRHLQHTAGVCGFAHPVELYQAMEDAVDGALTLPIDVASKAEERNVAKTVHALFAEANRLSDDLMAAIGRLDVERLTDEVIALVRDRWRLPWPWLACELFSCWTTWLRNAPLSQTATVTFAAAVDPVAPAIRFAFETRDGERASEATVRFVREAIDAVLKPLAAEAAALPTGKRTSPTIVRKYVEWWYRNLIGYRVRGDRAGSIRSLAEGDYGGRGKQVRYGIKQAERWLSVPRYGWKGPADSAQDAS